MKKNKIIALGLVGTMTLGSFGVAGASYLSQYDKASALINQLSDIARENKSSASTSGAMADEYREQANSYQNTITNMYRALGKNPPSDIGNISDSELNNLLNQYVASHNSANNIEGKARDEVFNEVNNRLGTNFRSASEIAAYVSDLNNQRESDNSHSEGRYLNALKQVYSAINSYPSDGQLLSKSESEIYSDVQGYIQQMINQSASSSQATAEANVVQQLASQLGIEAHSINDISNQIQTTKNNYQALQQEYNNMSSSNSQATADMENTIQSLRQQITELGYTPVQ